MKKHSTHMSGLAMVLCLEPLGRHFVIRRGWADGWAGGEGRGAGPVLVAGVPHITQVPSHVAERVRHEPTRERERFDISKLVTWPHVFQLFQVSGSVSGSGFRVQIRIQGAKITHKNIKKYRSVMFWSARCSLLRAKGFFCGLGVPYGGQGISKLQFFLKKYFIFFQL